MQNGTLQLADGSRDLFKGSRQVYDGIEELRDGAEQLRDGEEKFNNEGIEKLKEVLGDEFDTIMDRLAAVQDDDVTYTSFTDRAEGMDGSIRFIIETEPVR